MMVPIHESVKLMCERITIVLRSDISVEKKEIIQHMASTPENICHLHSLLTSTSVIWSPSEFMGVARQLMTERHSIVCFTCVPIKLKVGVIPTESAAYVLRTLKSVLAVFDGLPFCKRRTLMVVLPCLDFNMTTLPGAMIWPLIRMNMMYAKLSTLRLVISFAAFSEASGGVQCTTGISNIHIQSGYICLSDLVASLVSPNSGGIITFDDIASAVAEGLGYLKELSPVKLRSPIRAGSISDHGASSSRSV